MVRSVDKYNSHKFMGVTIRAKGFPYNPKNITSITGPHPFIWWKKIEYYKRGRRNGTRANGQ